MASSPAEQRGQELQLGQAAAGSARAGRGPSILEPRRQPEQREHPLGVEEEREFAHTASLELEHLYYVGFHFAEQAHPLGEELLRAVVERGGRAKIAKMARSKLALAEQA